MDLQKKTSSEVATSRLLGYMYESQMLSINYFTRLDCAISGYNSLLKGLQQNRTPSYFSPIHLNRKFSEQCIKKDPATVYHAFSEEIVSWKFNTGNEANMSSPTPGTSLAGYIVNQSSTCILNYIILVNAGGLRGIGEFNALSPKSGL